MLEFLNVFPFLFLYIFASWITAMQRPTAVVITAVRTTHPHTHIHTDSWEVSQVLGKTI